MTQLSRVAKSKTETKKRNKRVAGVALAIGVAISSYATFMNSVNAEKNEAAPTIQKEKVQIEKEVSLEVKGPKLDKKVVETNVEKKVLEPVPAKKEVAIQEVEVKPVQMDAPTPTKTVSQPKVTKVATKTEVKPVKVVEQATKEVPVKEEPKQDVKVEVVKEMLGTLIGKLNANSFELDVLGDIEVLNAGGNEAIQKEFAGYTTGTGLVVRYTIASDGQKIIKDLVKVSDPVEGDLSQFIEGEYVGMKGNSIIVMVNNIAQRYELSPAFVGRNLDNEFAPGTKVSLATVKTAAGLIVENISEL